MATKNIVEKFIQNWVEYEVPSKTSDLTNDSWFVDESDVLTKTNTEQYTPTSNYHPATKKYVDDIVWNIETLLANL